MNKGIDFLNALVSGLLEGKIESIIWIAIIAFILSKLVHLYKWVVTKYRKHFGVLFVLLLCILGYGYYTQPEKVRSVVNLFTTKLEVLLTPLLS